MSSFEPRQTPTPVLKSSVGVRTRSAHRAAYSHASQNRIKKPTAKKRVGNSSSTGNMQSERPRQRTFTSCTECRRRKQRVLLLSSYLVIPVHLLPLNTTNKKQCNQAKDRPCNNCARRYPPVACTYDSARYASLLPISSPLFIVVKTPIKIIIIRC